MIVQGLSMISITVWTVNPRVSGLDATGSWNVRGLDETPVAYTQNHLVRCSMSVLSWGYVPRVVSKPLNSLLWMPAAVHTLVLV